MESTFFKMREEYFDTNARGPRAQRQALWPRSSLGKSTGFHKGLIILSVHLFYIRRLWILSEGASYRVMLALVVTILAITHFGLEIAVMILTFKYPEFSQFRKITGAYTSSMAVAAACDIVIAVAMWHLLDSRRSGVKSTNFMVDRIITFVLTTGTLTSVVDLAILICFVAMPDNLVYLAIFGLINNLYANSLLAMLNARQSLGKMSVGGTTSFALSDLRGPANTVSTPQSGFDRPNNLNGVRSPQGQHFGPGHVRSGMASHV
ncbi:hypothetical protein V8D89_015383 [Ganoderma adspersum]